MARRPSITIDPDEKLIIINFTKYAPLGAVKRMIAQHPRLSYVGVEGHSVVASVQIPKFKTKKNNRQLVRFWEKLVGEVAESVWKEQDKNLTEHGVYKRSTMKSKPASKQRRLRSVA